MTSTPLRPVTDEERELYRRDGVVKLEQIHPPDWVERLRAAMEDVFAASQGREREVSAVISGDSKQGASTDMAALLRRLRAEHPGADWATETNGEIRGRSIVETDACGWHNAMRSHHIESPLVEVVHQLTGSNKINLYSDQLFFKEAGSQVKTPWHQDKPYWMVDGGDMAVAWVTIDRVRRENGAMGYVRGSHLWGKLFKPSDFQTETGTFPEVEGISLMGLDTLDPTALKEEDIIYFDAEPGDVIVHHWATLHGSTGNTAASGSRRAASVRYALDGCYFYNRPSSPEPFRKTLTLNDGDPLEYATRFPVVWPRT